ncbi:MAG: hypothetical protein H8E05_01435 [Bacteroidetes bacterium]|nr:hypothetical protein [Bacteroidota bacterium]
MKKQIQTLVRWKNTFTELLDNNTNKILSFTAILLAVFLFNSFSNATHAREEMILMEKNSDLLLENHSLKFMIHRQGLYIHEQRKIIYDLEGFKKAVLEGNFTQNENTKQNKLKMVGEQKVRDLGI